MAILLKKTTNQVTLSTTSVDVIVATYDPARSILRCTYRGGDTQPDNGAVSWEKFNATTLRFTRDDSAAGTDPVIEWELLEFDSSVAVQDLSRVGDGIIAINAIDLNRSFIVANGILSSGTIFNDNDFGAWRINSTTEVEVLTSVASNQTYRCQVVDFQGATVQALVHSLVASVATSTDDTITSIDQTKSIIFSSYETSSPTGDDFADMLWRARFLNDTTVRFEREGTVSVTVDFHYFVVSFTDGTKVQSGLHTVADTDAQDDITIPTAVVVANTSVWLGAASAMTGMHGTAAVLDDDTRDAFFSVILLNPTTIRVDRAETSLQCQLSWFAIEWSPGAPDPFVTVEIRAA